LQNEKHENVINRETIDQYEKEKRSIIEDNRNNYDIMMKMKAD